MTSSDGVGFVTRIGWRAFGRTMVAINKASAESTSIEGIEVRMLPAIDNRGVTEQLREALGTINELAPWTLSHARRLIDGIQIFVQGAPRWEWHTGAVDIGSEWLRGTSPDLVAAALYHQFTLARIRARMPVGRQMMRVTRLAFDKRIRFCRHLPNGAAMIDQLSFAWDQGFYTSNAMKYSQALRIEESMSELADLGVPMPMRTGLRRMGYWVLRRRFK